MMLVMIVRISVYYLHFVIVYHWFLIMDIMVVQGVMVVIVEMDRGMVL